MHYVFPCSNVVARLTISFHFFALGSTSLLIPVIDHQSTTNTLWLQASLVVCVTSPARPAYASRLVHSNPPTLTQNCVLISFMHMPRLTRNWLLHWWTTTKPPMECKNYLVTFINFRWTDTNIIRTNINTILHTLYSCAIITNSTKM